MAPKRALITGITGQDGHYLARLLAREGYECCGVSRAATSRGRDLEAALGGALALANADMADHAGVAALIRDFAPSEVYHLASPTFVPDSWRDPDGTHARIAGDGEALLRACEEHAPDARVFVACSGEIFGDAGESPQRETTVWRPTNPYAEAKLALHRMVAAARGRGLFACSGILYNHESPLRPERFVTRKVTRGAAAIRLGLERELVLGGLDAVRDWSHAADTVRAAWMMLQAPEPDDYIVASGVGRTVAELVGVAFGCVGVDPNGPVRVDEAFSRPPEPCPRVGDASKLRSALGWTPEITFEAMIAEMVEADLESLRGAGP